MRGTVFRDYDPVKDAAVKYIVKTGRQRAVLSGDQGHFVIPGQQQGNLPLWAVLEEKDSDGKTIGLWMSPRECVWVDPNLGSNPVKLNLEKKDEQGGPAKQTRCRSAVGVGMSLRLRRVPLLWAAGRQVAGSLSSKVRLTGTIGVKEGGKLRSRASVTISELASTDDAEPRQTDAGGRFEVEVELGRTYSMAVVADGHVFRTFLIVVTEAGEVKAVDDSGRPTLLDRIELDAADGDVSDGTGANGNEDITLPLEQRTHSIAYSFGRTWLDALPFPGMRRADDLAFLVPGVAPAAETPGRTGPGISAGMGTAGQFAVNGMRGRENNFLVDGSDNNDEDVGVRRQGFVALFPQSMESVEEFQIITLAPDARFGRGVGAQVNVLSRYGGQAFHGSMYGYGTATWLRTRDTFDTPGELYPERFQRELPVTADGSLSGPVVRIEAAPGGFRTDASGVTFQRNPAGAQSRDNRGQAGAAVGGPLRKRSTYFFVSGERLQGRASPRIHYAVPTVQERGLDRKILDSGVRYPATVFGSAVFNLFPLPNNPLGPYGSNTFTSRQRADANGWLGSAKADHHFRAAVPHVATIRYNVTDENSWLPAIGDALASTVEPRIRTGNVASYINTQFSPSLSGTFRGSFGRTTTRLQDGMAEERVRSRLYPDADFLLNAPLLLNTSDSGGARLSAADSIRGCDALRTFGYGCDAGTEGVTGPVGYVRVAGFSAVGADPFHVPQTRRHKTLQFAYTANLYRSRGNRSHFWNFGFDWRRLRLDSTVERNRLPALYFNGLRRVPQSALRCPGFAGVLGPCPEAEGPDVFSAAALAAAGVPAAVFHTLTFGNGADLRLRRTQADFFVQDQIQLKPRVRIIGGFRLLLHRLPKDVENGFLQAFNYDQLVKATNSLSEAPDCSPDCRAFGQALVRSFPATLPEVFGADPEDSDFRLGLVWRARDNSVIRVGYANISGAFPAILINESRSAFPASLPLNLGRSIFQLRTLFGGTGLAERILAAGSLHQLKASGDPSTDSSAAALSLLVRELRPLDATLSPTQPGAGLKNAVGHHFSLMTEHRFSMGWVGSAGYAGTLGRKLLRVTTPENGPARAYLGFSGVRSAGLLPSPDISLYYPGQQFPVGATPVVPIARTQFEGTATSAFHSLQIEVRGQHRRGFTHRTAFTLSHAIDDVSDFFDLSGAFALPQNSLHRSERGSAGFDQRLQLVNSFVWDLPWPRGGKWGGWQLAGIAAARSGQPFTVNSSFDANQDGNLTDRPMNSDAISRVSDGAARLRLLGGPGALLAAPGKDGSLGRNTFRGHAMVNLDVAASKTLRVQERNKLQLRLEAFNLSNRNHYALPVRILEMPGFGRSVKTQAPARTLQLGLKYVF